MGTSQSLLHSPKGRSVLSEPRARGQCRGRLLLLRTREAGWKRKAWEELWRRGSQRKERMWGTTGVGGKDPVGWGLPR